MALSLEESILFFTNNILEIKENFNVYVKQASIFEPKFVNSWLSNCAQPGMKSEIRHYSSISIVLL